MDDLVCLEKHLRPQCSLFVQTELLPVEFGYRIVTWLDTKLITPILFESIVLSFIQARLF